MNRLGHCILVLALNFLPAAFGYDSVRPFSWYIELGSRFHIVKPIADSSAGGTYEKKFSQGFESALRAGFTEESLYLGLVYEYWSSTRKLTQNGSAISDVLHYSSVGPELGMVLQQSYRLFWMFTGTAFIPLQNEVESTVDSQTTTYRGKKMLSYQLRADIGFRLSHNVSMMMGGGYRWSR